MYLAEKKERILTSRAKPRAKKPELTDEELLVLIGTGNQKAYGMLAQRYVGKIWRLAMSILKNEQEAEDAVQDVFVSMLQSMKKWDPDGSAKFSTWIYRVSFNKCIDIKRKRKPSESTDTLQMQSEDRNAYQETLHNQISEQLSGHLDNLPDMQQEALHLYYFEEMTVEEIAIKLDNTAQGVRSLLKRGKAALRDKMQYDQTFRAKEMAEMTARPVI